jgi:hypothetical protein
MIAVLSHRLFVAQGILAFVLVSPALRAEEGCLPGGPNVHFRGSLDNARIRFQWRHEGRVAFMGGSITEMNGYRPLVCEILKKRFPQTQFTFIDAGISSTCSTTGAFRLFSDVLSKGPVDLFFIEFAVNDDQDARHARCDCIRGTEGILRQALRHNPQMDIVITYFVNPEMLATIQAGKTPLTIAAHETVAEHYAISAIDLAKEVADRIAAGRLTWEKFGGTHPAPCGNAICAGMIDMLFARAWGKPLASDFPVRHRLPEPLDPLSYGEGRFVDPSVAAIKQGWKLEVPPWASLKGSTRSRFDRIFMLSTDQPGSELSLKFNGTAVGAYVVAGPDAGIVEARIDGGPPRQINLFHRFSAGLHYPRTIMFANDLQPGPHVLALRMTDKTRSSGHAMRIIQFAVNGSSSIGMAVEGKN